MKPRAPVDTASNGQEGPSGIAASASGCFQVMLRTLRDSAVLLDEAGRVLEVNLAFETLTGHSRAQLMGQDFRLWCKPAEGESSTQEPKSNELKLLGVTPFHGQVQLRTAEREELLVSAQVSRAELQGFTGYVFLAWPAIEFSQKSFEQTRLESLGVLSSGIVHDLNNILTGILGHVSFLRLSLEDTFGDQESILAIEDGARKAATLTHQILEFARGEEIELMPVDFPQIVRQCMNLVRASVPANIALSYYGNESGSEELAFVSGNEGQLHQLVMNLTVNARDALPDGGEIRVELGEAWYYDPAFCRQEGIQPGEYVTLSVIDNGTGIPEDVREKIFEPFFTTKGGRGTGLGLATVQAIVKAHRGSLIVESSPEFGTAFRVALPRTAAQSETVVEKAQVAIATGSERILIVDDEDSVRMIMQRSLEHLGYEVRTAVNGAEALELYLEDPEGFDLIVVDMIMPRMSGDELFYRLKEIDPGIPVMVASGYASDGRTRAILRDGALGFIQKPFAIEELAQMVRDCLDRTHPERSQEVAA